jgi:hypothetical protein
VVIKTKKLNSNRASDIRAALWSMLGHSLLEEIDVCLPYYLDLKTEQAINKRRVVEAVRLKKHQFVPSG